MIYLLNKKRFANNNTSFLNNDILKMSIFILLVLYFVGLIYYLTFITDIHVLFTHVFYLIIVLAGIFLGRKSIGVAVFLGGCVLLFRFFYHSNVFFIEDFLHIIMFIIIAVVISILKEAENQLKASEITFRELFDNMGSGAIIYEEKGNGEDFIIKNINKAGERISRLKKKDIIGKGILEVLPCIKESGFLDVFRRVYQTGKSEYFPLTKYYDEKTIRLLDDYICKMPNGKLFSIYDDVTEKKQTEKTLRESEEKFRKLFYNANDDIFLFELKQDKTMGQFIEVNNIACKRLGYNRNELLNMTPNDIMASECLIKVSKVVESYIKNGHASFELTYISKAGLPIPTELSSHVFTLDGKTVVMSIGRDISERKRAEETLQYYQLLSNTVRDIILMIYPNGRIIEANQAAIEAYGYTREEFLKLRIDDLQAVNGEGEQNGGSGKIYETVHCRKDGIIFPVEVSRVETTIGSKHILLGIMRDISERKQNELKMQQAKEMANRAERLASLGRMAAGIAHEINQPLNSLKVTADGMLYWYNRGKPFDGNKVMKNLNKISDQAVRIDNIIKHMRLFVRSECSIELIPCNLNSVLERALDLIGNQILAHRIKVRKVFCDQLPLIKGEDIHLEQIAINLLINAMQALDLVDRKNKEIICTTMIQDQVIMEISDNGPGVSDETKSKIFDPFFSTKPIGKGMGLGLAIVHSKVEAFNGKIFLEKNQQGGATFRVKFPIYKE